VNDVRFVGSVSILPQVMEAAQRSATSSSELARDGREVGPRNRLNPLALLEISHVAGSLGGNTRPSSPQPTLCAAIPSSCILRRRALHRAGARNDTRSTLRSFFEVDSHHVIVAALVVQGRVSREKVSERIARYGLETHADPHGFVEANWACVL
jgi:pyruvate dehydrogenase E1 component